MIGYVTLGSNDMAKAANFYDALLADIGATRLFDAGNIIAWGHDMGSPLLGVAKPFDGNDATAGNGTMIALAASNREQVDTLHAKALSLGAADEGAPGIRGGGFYCAYFRDMDGNKLNFFCSGE